MPVAVYLRVSTEEQKERQSIQTQREFAERYCELHHLSAFHVYADDGVSGTLPLHSRPEGRQILHDARLRRFDQLLVYKLDRLGRETRLTLDAVAELESCGVRIKSMTHLAGSLFTSAKIQRLRSDRQSVGLRGRIQRFSAQMFYRMWRWPLTPSMSKMTV